MIAMNQAGEWREQDLADERRTSEKSLQRDRCEEGEKSWAETKSQPKKTRLPEKRRPQPATIPLLTAA